MKHYKEKILFFVPFFHCVPDLESMTFESSHEEHVEYEQQLWEIFLRSIFYADFIYFSKTLWYSEKTYTQYDEWGLL